MKIKGFKCARCGNDDFYTEVSKGGNHTGLYCSYCGKWLKWASKEEKRLISGKTYKKLLNKQFGYQREGVDNEFNS